MLLSKIKHSLNFSVEVFITLKNNVLALPFPTTKQMSWCQGCEHCCSACLIEFLAQLFMDTGYEEVVNEYVFRETVNKKEGLCVPRVFLQSKFRKSPKNPPAVTPGLGHRS